MIERIIAKLAAGGVTDAVLALGYRPDAFIEAYPDDTCAGVTLHYAVESELLDAAGAVPLRRGRRGHRTPSSWSTGASSPTSTSASCRTSTTRPAPRAPSP